MKVFKFIPPYNPKTKKPNFPSRGKAGVYLIKEEGSIVYVGYSSKDLYKTMYRHFQRWDHPTQEVITYAGDLDKLEFTVRVVYCTPKQAEALEKALIKKHKPRDNAQKYEDTLLTAYDRAALENYGTEIPEAPKFSKRELEVMEEDRRYFEERAGQSKAIFGDEDIEKNIEKELKEFEEETKARQLKSIVTIDDYFEETNGYFYAFPIKIAKEMVKWVFSKGYNKDAHMINVPQKDEKFTVEYNRKKIDYYFNYASFNRSLLHNSKHLILGSFSVYFTNESKNLIIRISDHWCAGNPFTDRDFEKFTLPNIASCYWTALESPTFILDEIEILKWKLRLKAGIAVLNEDITRYDRLNPNFYERFGKTLNKAHIFDRYK